MHIEFLARGTGSALVNEISSMAGKGPGKYWRMESPSRSSSTGYPDEDAAENCSFRPAGRNGGPLRAMRKATPGGGAGWPRRHRTGSWGFLPVGATLCAGALSEWSQSRLGA